MRTVLCRKTAGHVVCLLALMAGTVGGGLALPASAAVWGDTSSTGGGPHQHPAAQHRTHGPAVGVGERRGKSGTAVLGPAVKYVRLADGTIGTVRPARAGGRDGIAAAVLWSRQS